MRDGSDLEFGLNVLGKHVNVTLSTSKQKMENFEPPFQKKWFLFFPETKGPHMVKETILL